MIRSYLGYVEVMQMISRRLSQIQKLEILEAYKAGDNTNVLAGKYGCTTNTINRTVKTLLSESEYALLKEKRLKNTNKNEQLVDNQISMTKKKDLEQSDSLSLVDKKNQEETRGIYMNEENNSIDIGKTAYLDLEDSLSENHNNQSFDNNFEVIAPLISSFELDVEKQKSDFEIHTYESLPEIVYMIVDKKVELEMQPISDLPEWSFLPENELKRNALLLFSNQRSAKRSCSRNQRVIKVPNTTVFEISKSYLISKGITRLIIEDSIIALDN